MSDDINQQLHRILNQWPLRPDILQASEGNSTPGAPSISYLFFSDVRKDISDKEKYEFTRTLVEFADQSGFEAVYFPERHFYEFGSIFANNSVAAAYFAGLTNSVRLRTAAVTASLHHPVRIVEDWAMIDVLSDGRVDLGFGNGWNKPDFILSPDTYTERAQIRNERIPIIQQLWRGEELSFVGPDGEEFPTIVYPRPLQKELNVWYVTLSEEGFIYAGEKGYNIFTMLYGIDLTELGKKIQLYRNARKLAGLDPQEGTVSLMMHTFVHPDDDYIQSVVAEPFKAYIRSSLLPQVKSKSEGKDITEDEIQKMVDFSYARYFKTGGIFGSVEDCMQQVDKAVEAGVNDIALLQDFGVDYDAVINALPNIEDLMSAIKQRYKSSDKTAVNL